MSYGLTLAVDGSTYAGTVAVLSDTTVLAERTLVDVPTPGRGGRDELFLPMVAACLGDAGVDATRIARVVCGAGPGGFTSLRIAASLAKGIAVGAGCPLFSVSSLMLIVAGRDAEPGRYLAVLPAMRGEAFVALFEVGSRGISEVGPPSLINDADLASEARKLGAVLIGPGMPNPCPPHARGVARILALLVAVGERDIRTWEPAYGRLAEAQVKWEAEHGRPLTVVR